MRPVRVGSVFSGIGAIDLAFERAGCRIEWQVEIDPTCNRVLARHWPGVPRYGDIRTVKGADLAPVDVIVGGWPCVGHSVAGKRGGLADDRSGLFHHFARLVAECRPRFVVAENVPGLLSQSEDFRTVLRALDDLGYVGAWRICNAEFWGVAQRRRRVFLVAGLGAAGACAPKILGLTESGGGYTAPRRETGERIAATIASSSDRSGGYRNDADTAENLIVGPVSGGAWGSGRRTEDDPNLILTPVAALWSNHDGDHDGATSQLVLVARSLNGHHPISDGDSETLVTHTLSSEGADASEDGTGRGVPLIPTAMGVRRLLPVECLRLMALPDDWLDVPGRPLSDSAKYRMIGNSVVVTVLGWLARRLVNVAGEVTVSILTRRHGRVQYLTRAEVEARLEELLGLERQAVLGGTS